MNQKMQVSLMQCQTLIHDPTLPSFLVMALTFHLGPRFAKLGQNAKITGDTIEGSQELGQGKLNAIACNHCHVSSIFLLRMLPVVLWVNVNQLVLEVEINAFHKAMTLLLCLKKCHDERKKKCEWHAAISSTVCAEEMS